MINQKNTMNLHGEVIDKMFNDDTNYLVNHHISSYNAFF